MEIAHLGGFDKLLSQVRDVHEKDRLVAEGNVIEQDEMLVNHPMEIS